MTALFLVLNKVECLEKLLLHLADAGVSGGTIIESTGMARVLGDSEDNNFLGSLRMLIDPARQESKTIFFVLPDSTVQTVKEIIDEEVGGISNPDTGVLFGFKVDFFDGIGGAAK